MKISEIIVMDPRTAGYLDWFSGVLFVNESFEFWERYKKLSDEQSPAFGSREQNLAQTITHETYHFLQITTSGYLYQFASRLFSEMAPLIGGPLDQDALERLLANPPRPTSAMEQLFAEISYPPAPLVSPRALVESAAYLYEHRVHLAELTDAGFREVLKRDRPPIEYRIAYDVLHRACGADAFHNLLPLSFLALCFADPARAFPMLMDAAIAKGAVYRSAQDLPTFLALVQEFPHEPLLGSAAEVAVRYEEQRRQQHPVYHPAVAQLNRLSEQISPLRLVMEPDAMTDDTAAWIVQPIRFNDGHVNVPPKYEEFVGPIAHDLIFALSIMAAISHRITSYEESRVRPQD